MACLLQKVCNNRNIYFRRSITDGLFQTVSYRGLSKPADEALHDGLLISISVLQYEHILPTVYYRRFITGGLLPRMTQDQGEVLHDGLLQNFKK